MDDMTVDELMDDIGYSASPDNLESFKKTVLPEGIRRGLLPQGYDPFVPNCDPPMIRGEEVQRLIDIFKDGGELQQKVSGG